MYSDKDELKREALTAIIALAVYAVNRALKEYVAIPYIGYICKCHLNDYLGGIVICAYTNALLLISKREAIHNLCFIALYTLFCGICWEYIFPLIIKIGTSDIWDVVSYSLGGVSYYLIVSFNKGKRKI